MLTHIAALPFPGSPVTGGAPVTVFDRKNRRIELVEVATQESTDSEYYLKVTSPTKALKEESMYRQFMQRYEQGLAVIAKGIASKGGVKKYDKVNQRIGRLQQKYPSVHRMYKVDLQKDAKDICTDMTWQLIQEVSVEKQDSLGVYFLRTSLVGDTQEVIWAIYNCVREIENSFRTLKTYLDLRPIFHKTDEASQAHLHLGILGSEYRPASTQTSRNYCRMEGIGTGDEHAKMCNHHHAQRQKRADIHQALFKTFAESSLDL